MSIDKIKKKFAKEIANSKIHLIGKHIKEIHKHLLRTGHYHYVSGNSKELLYQDRRHEDTPHHVKLHINKEGNIHKAEKIIGGGWNDAKHEDVKEIAVRERRTRRGNVPAKMIDITPNQSITKQKTSNSKLRKLLSGMVDQLNDVIDDLN